MTDNEYTDDEIVEYDSDGLERQSEDDEPDSDDKDFIDDRDEDELTEESENPDEPSELELDEGSSSESDDYQELQSKINDIIQGWRDRKISKKFQK